MRDGERPARLCTSCADTVDPQTTRDLRKCVTAIYCGCGCLLAHRGVLAVHLCLHRPPGERGLLELDRSAFTRQVAADCEIDEPTQAYCVPVGGAPMPTDMTELDLSKWKPVHEDPELMTVVRGKVKAAEDGTPKAS
jgi:hypothetical protein